MVTDEVIVQDIRPSMAHILVEHNVILNMELVQVTLAAFIIILELLLYNMIQSNEVDSSYHMEKEGLVRGLDYFESQDLSLVTDRHKQIDAWLKKNKPNIDHRYYVWHVVKCKCLAIQVL